MSCHSVLLDIEFREVLKTLDMPKSKGYRGGSSETRQAVGECVKSFGVLYQVPRTLHFNNVPEPQGLQAFVFATVLFFSYVR